MAGVDLGAAYLAILPDTSQIAPGVRKALGDTTKTAERQGSRIGGAVSSGVKKAVKWGSLGASIAGALTIKGGISRLMQIDDARAKLKGLGMDAKQIEAIQKNVDAAVTGTAYSLAEGMTAATTAMASGVRQGKELENYLRLIGDVATQGGTSYGEMAQIINKVQAKGRVGMENLNQLTERGIGIQAMLAEHYGVSAAELEKMVSAGKVSAADFTEVLEKNFAGSAQAAGDTVRGSFANMRTSFSRLGAAFMEPIFEKLPAVFSGITDAVKGLQPQAEALGERLGELAEKYGPKLLDFFKSLEEPLLRVARGMRATLGWIVDNWQVVATFTGILGGYALTVKAVAKAKQLWAAAQLLLNNALKANPIGMIVTALAALAAGLVYAYQNSETFRNVVDTAWRAIKDAVMAAWDGYIKPALTAFADYVTGTLWPAIQNFYTSVIQPVFSAIGTAVGWAWNNVIKPVFSAWWAYISNVLWPVFQTLATIVWDALTRIWSVISFAWRNVISPIFNAWWGFIKNVLAPVISWLWNNVVSPVFGWIGSRVRDIWNNWVKPAFDRMKDGVKAVGTAFDTAKNAVKTAWDKLKGIVREPIQASITFINDKLIDGINKVIPGKGPLARIPGFATGGRVYGPGTAKSDSILAKLSNGEHVLTAADVKALGGHARVEALRAAARRGQFQIPGYANGGRVWPTRSRSMGRGYPGHTGVDFALPMGSPVFAAADGRITSTAKWGRSYGWHINQQAGPYRLIYAHLSRIIAQTGQMVKAGMHIGDVGSTGNSTGPHLHFEVRPPGTQAGSAAWLRGANTASGAAIEQEQSALDWIKSKFNIDAILDSATGYFRGKGGIFGDAGIASLVKHVGSKFWDFIKDKASGLMGFASDLGGKIGNLFKGVFDQGGVAHGEGLLMKQTVQPERVLSPRQTRAFEAALSRDFGSGDGWLQMEITNWETGEGRMRWVSRDEALRVVAVRDRAAAGTRSTPGVTR